MISILLNQSYSFRISLRKHLDTHLPYPAEQSRGAKKCPVDISGPDSLVKDLQLSTRHKCKIQTLSRKMKQ